ncbi:hypothetical protein ZWY2020_040354 [Hordeum vulgare]|nr:hypothetical protein ZWY2020_040354 [Hordeum vulgare]
MGNQSMTQALVKWCDSTTDDATWEDLEFLKQQFPHAPAWGQADFQKGKIISSTDTRKGVTSVQNSTTTATIAGFVVDQARDEGASRFEPNGGPEGWPVRNATRPKWHSGPEWRS